MPVSAGAEQGSYHDPGASLRSPIWMTVTHCKLSSAAYLVHCITKKLVKSGNNCRYFDVKVSVPNDCIPWSHCSPMYSFCFILTFAQELINTMLKLARAESKEHKSNDIRVHVCTYAYIYLYLYSFILLPLPLVLVWLLHTVSCLHCVAELLFPYAERSTEVSSLT